MSEPARPPVKAEDESQQDIKKTKEYRNFRKLLKQVIKAPRGCERRKVDSKKRPGGFDSYSNYSCAGYCRILHGRIRITVH